MTKYFSYFHLAPGLSKPMRDAIRDMKKRGFKALPLKGVRSGFGSHNVVIHLHESRYEHWFNQIHPILFRDGVAVEFVDIPDVPSNKVEDGEETVVLEGTVVKDLTTSHTTVDIDLSKTDPESVSEAPPGETPDGKQEDAIDPKAAIVRPRRSKDAPILFQVEDRKQHGKLFAKLGEITAETKNPIHVVGSASVSDIPEDLEYYVSFQPYFPTPEELKGYRGVVTTTQEGLEAAIRYAIPVVYLGRELAKAYAGFFSSEIPDNFLSLPVASVGDRQAILDR